MTSYTSTYKKSLCRKSAVVVALGLSTVCVSLTSTQAEELVISAGVQEMYDDNIYLENDKGLNFNIPESGQAGQAINVPEQINGDPDDDLITNVFLGMSSAVPLSPHLKTGAEAKVGALIFADHTDESRLTLDATFTSAAEESLLPRPWYADTKVALASRANDISAAEGTATEQAETLFTGLNLGVRKVNIAPSTDWGLGYSFGYNDFLGDWLFNDNTDDLGIYENAVGLEGSDYITNSTETGVDYSFSEKLGAGVFANLTDYYFTDVESNDPTEQDSSDLNRDDAVFGVRTSYRPTEQVSANGMAGLLLSHLQNKPEDVLVSVPGTDGNTITVPQDGDQDTTSLVFNADLNYAPDQPSLLKLGVNQSSQTDIDGQRVYTRSVFLNGSRAFGERFKALAMGRFFQFDNSDSLSNATERYEVSLALQYNITESIALGAGWNYINQNAEEDNLQNRLEFGNEDYEDNRFFIGLTGGLVGKKS